MVSEVSRLAVDGQNKNSVYLEAAEHRIYGVYINT